MSNILLQCLLFAVLTAVAAAAAAGGGPHAIGIAKKAEAAEPTLATSSLERRGELRGLKTSPDIEFHSRWLMVSLAAFTFIPLAYRICAVVYSRVRLMVCLGVENQRYFALPTNEWACFVKKHMLYAPLFRVRHNREFRLSTAVNVGTLPTRFQTFFLLCYFVGNAVFCTSMIDWKEDGAQVVLRQVMNRTGVLAAVNMVPLFLLAGRNNPLIQLLGISFDAYNLIHRWLGRIVVLEAVAHTVCYMVAKSMKGGWGPVLDVINTSPFILFGFIGTVCFVFLIVHSPSVLRHAYYETFLTLHIIAASVAVTSIYYHLAVKDYAWIIYVKIAIALWATDRGLRLLRLLYRNFGLGKMTTATCEALPGGAVRVTIQMARPWKFAPGQHLYLYMPRLALWTSHPFTVSWSEGENDIQFDEEKLSPRACAATGEARMSLIIRRRAGFTDALFTKAYGSPNRTLTTRALVEGPYGTAEPLQSYGSVVLIAGGIGITHPVSYLRELISAYAQGTAATRRVVLVWVVQIPEHLEWIRPWMTEILAMEKRREVLKVMIFITRPKSREVHSVGTTVQVSFGRPNIDTLLDFELEQKLGKMAVVVCGNGSLSDDVRRAVRNRVHSSNIDFIEEAFSW